MDSIVKVTEVVGQKDARFGDAVKIAMPGRRPQTNGVDPGVGPAIRDLARLRPGPHHVVSCYLRLEPGDKIRQKYFLKLKGALAQAATAVARLEPALREPVERDLRRVMRSVESTAQLPAVPGVAVFACEAHKLFLTVPMPRVHHTRVMVDRAPSLAELLAVEEETGRILVAALDRTATRFFEVTAFDVRELPALDAVSTRGGKFLSDREDSPGWGERSFHHRIETERHRHFAAIGRRLAELDRAQPAHGIVLAGPLEETRAAARFLPPPLSSRYMGAARLNRTALRSAEVQAAVLRLRRKFETRREHEFVAELETKVAEGWAANGPQPVLRALARGQVRTLLIRPDQSGSGYRCADTGRLVLSKAECRGEGTPRPVADLMNEAIEEALRQRAGITVIHDPDVGGAIDGLAAELRFR
jgi:peptide subunit release factor 1 (eRF1)